MGLLYSWFAERTDKVHEAVYAKDQRALKVALAGLTKRYEHSCLVGNPLADALRDRNAKAVHHLMANKHTAHLVENFGRWEKKAVRERVSEYRFIKLKKYVENNQYDKLAKFLKVDFSRKIDFLLDINKFKICDSSLSELFTEHVSELDAEKVSSSLRMNCQYKTSS